jgi:hypothetical protein
LPGRDGGSAAPTPHPGPVGAAGTALETLRVAADVVVDVRHTLEGMQAAAAWFDHTRAYRYLLTRRWHPTDPPLVWVLLNPSTADALRLDPTVTRCVKRARGLGYGACWVLNLYAFRATNPADLAGVVDPVGVHNDSFLRQYTADLPHSRVVVGWGSGGPDPTRPAAVRELLGGVALWCLGVNGDGNPRHPGRLAHSARLVPYRP